VAGSDGGLATPDVLAWPLSDLVQIPVRTKYGNSECLLFCRPVFVKVTWTEPLFECFLLGHFLSSMEILTNGLTFEFIILQRGNEIRFAETDGNPTPDSNFRGVGTCRRSDDCFLEIEARAAARLSDLRPPSIAGSSGAPSRPRHMCPCCTSGANGFC
jgi:hypothetical protein